MTGSRRGRPDAAQRLARAVVVAVLILLLPSPAGAGPTFEHRIDRVTRAEVSESWRRGCPLHWRKLRKLTLTYIAFDGSARTGRLVVGRRWAEPMVRVFRRLFNAGYPIKRMRPVDRFGGSDRRSMRRNNTSAFNCREATGSDRWSEHAFGRAVDINPVQNPYVSRSGRVLPRRGRRFVDRSRRHPAMIHAGDVVVRVFGRHGWSWGGRWSSVKDYQHFSSTGR